ncbi:NYN domain-containing protein [Nocardia camponoti]|uniref:RNA-binding protein n=1 Tax=Nocardia camponoti TaxID=1616106 RepID=A0A917QPI8_9NOCA|nr:NYN domain-containing protein [Nocardia camponoti]GGK61885.1 hypothetical protein GCM10011591_37730 [Nocardia camponoti]
MTEPAIVVDVANVMGSRPNGWWKDRAGAAKKLLAQLADLGAQQHAEVVVILEGQAKSAGKGDESYPGVRVVLAKGEGDDTIVDVTAELKGRPTTVVTADRGLRERVEKLGAKTVGPGWLFERIDK